MVGVWYLINVLYLVMPGIGILLASSQVGDRLGKPEKMGEITGMAPNTEIGKGSKWVGYETGNPQKFCKSKDPPALHCLLSSWQDSLPPCQWWIYCSYLACVMVELMGKGVGL